LFKYFILLHICCVFRVQPDDVGAHINVGRTASSLQLYSEAEQAYHTALALLSPAPGSCLPININVHLNINDECKCPVRNRRNALKTVKKQHLLTPA